MDSYVTGTAIRQLREAKHMTQAELAEKLAVSAKAKQYLLMDKG